MEKNSPAAHICIYIMCKKGSQEGPNEVYFNDPKDWG